MIFTHPTNPDAKSANNLLVLQYGQESIVTAAASIYEDALAIVKREFDLPDDAKIQLYTKDVIPGNSQTAVRITESAWFALLPLLATVEVRIGQQTKNVTGVNTPASSAGPSQPVGKAAQKAPMPTPPEAAPARAPTNRTPNQPERPASKPTTKTAKPSTSRTPTKPEPGPSKSAAKPAAKPPPPPASKPAPAPKQSALAAFSDEDESFAKPAPPAQRSPSKKRVIQSDDEDDEDAPASAKRRRTGEDVHTATPVRVKQELQERVEPKEESKAKESTVARSEAQRAVAPQASPARTPKRRPVSSQGAATPASRVQSSASKVQADGSFIISVTLVHEDAEGEQDEDTTQFKTKARHTVRKVLWTACRTFGIQDSYAEVGLYMRNEKGLDVLCEDEETTIGEYGITSETVLTIQPREEEDEA